MKTKTESGFESPELSMVDWALSIKLLSLFHYILYSYTDNNNVCSLALGKSQVTFPYNLP